MHTPTSNNFASQYIPRLERILRDNIISFWYPQSLDYEDGGYLVDFDPVGERTKVSTKMIVTQARMMWFYSKAYNAGYGGTHLLDAASIGYSFLKNRMWDSTYGGFYWEVDISGSRKLRPKKHLYGQSFALYALTEYYLASGLDEAMDLAVELFHIIEARSHDSLYGGYVEFFEEDWTAPPPDEPSYLYTEPQLKLMNTHLHLLESITSFCRATRLPLAHQRLLELIAVESSSVVRKDLGACTDKYDRDWKPRLESTDAYVPFGHNIENVWLLMMACDVAGISNHLLKDLYKAIFDYSLLYGYDTESGGFYDSAVLNQPPVERGKSWWVQAEAIVGALYMFRLTSNSKYLSIFEKTYDFIEKYFVDWKHGEWHAKVTSAGTPCGDKGDAWKSAYHNGRAMIECLDLFKNQLTF